MPKISKRTVISLLILTALYIFGICTLLRAHVWFKDDMGRVVEGYLLWEQSSRYISNALAALINAGIPLTDQAPLQQIIAAFFMAAASLIMVRTLAISRKDSKDAAPVLDAHTALLLIAALAVGLNPYFLECFSFQFDSSFMALSVLAGVCPFVIGVSRRKWFLLAALLSTLVVLMTYQASSGIFPILVLFGALVLWMDRRMTGREALVFVAQSAAAYLVSVVLFRLVFMHNSEGYNNGSMIPLSRLIQGLAANYRKIASWIRNDFTPLWLVLFTAIVVMFFVTIVWTTQRSRVATLLASLAVLALSFLLSNGILIMLESLPTPRRSSYGIFVALACMMICIADRDRIFVGRVVCVAMVWVFVAFSFTYGNALAENNRLIDSRLSQVAQTLDELDVMRSETPKYVRLTGKLGHSETLERLKGQYPLLARMLPSNRAGYMWNIYRFIHCYGLENLYCDDVFVPDFDEEAFLVETAGLPVLAETANFDICGDGETVVVKVRK